MRVILSTCSPGEAEELLLSLLRERLVGCGNLIRGVVSRYWWEGEIASDEEVLLLMETTTDKAEAAVARREELHPYDVPKILTLDPVTTSAGYLGWLQSVTTD